MTQTPELISTANKSGSSWAWALPSARRDPVDKSIEEIDSGSGLIRRPRIAE